jgi:hypothetical protein
MAKRWNAGEDAAASAARALLRKMPRAARDAVIADVERTAPPDTRAEVRDLLEVERINGRLSDD